MHGKVDRIGLSGTNLTFQDEPTKKQSPKKFPTHRYRWVTKSAAKCLLLDWLEEQIDFTSSKRRSDIGWSTA